MKYFIKTFGCQQNHADSERVASGFKARGFSEAKNYNDANYIVINTCMIRQSAEDRVYGLVRNLGVIKKQKEKRKEFLKIIVTGCMVGMAFRDKSGQYLQKIRGRMPEVDEFLPIEEVGFDNQPVRQDDTHAWVPVSNGCNNFCTFCVVPFTRGREISRPFHDILSECLDLRKRGYRMVTLLGQNVNSYGADLLLGDKNIQTIRDLEKTYFIKKELAHPRVKIEFKLNGKSIEPVYVKHLGRYRIPTLFPYLLEAVAKMGFRSVNFISSNPWDFSDELIDTIARYKNITRTIHLPVQSGDDKVLKRMNRWYTAEQYLALISKLKSQISKVNFTTDIIVGFCGETKMQFENTLELAKKVGFEKAYISMYSQRPMTAATKALQDDVPHTVKKKRWQILEELINRSSKKN
ncbi:radical SAM protein [Candidatus Roizmanbacteria bacterium]|nr:radical SAM protein [Candidatus Roizmanbacteria bacterium]